MPSDQPDPRQPSLWMAAYGSVAGVRQLSSLFQQLAPVDTRACGSIISGESGIVWGSRAVVDTWVRQQASYDLGRKQPLPERHERLSAPG